MTLEELHQAIEAYLQEVTQNTPRARYERTEVILGFVEDWLRDNDFGLVWLTLDREIPS